MADKNVKYIGKVRNQQTQYGTMQKIYLDNLNPTNADGTPNKYYDCVLILVDTKTGEQFQVQQLSISVPKNGMNPNLAEKGYVAQVSVDLNDSYMVKKV